MVGRATLTIVASSDDHQHARAEDVEGEPALAVGSIVELGTHLRFPITRPNRSNQASDREDARCRRAPVDLEREESVLAGVLGVDVWVTAAASRRRSATPSGR